MIARLRSPVVLMIGPILVLAIAFYVWTGATSASMAPGNGADPYNELLDGFQQGHLYLPKKPDPRLAALANPYDPAQNAVYVTPDIRDVVLFERRFYIYWAPRRRSSSCGRSGCSASAICRPSMPCSSSP